MATAIMKNHFWAKKTMSILIIFLVLLFLSTCLSLKASASTDYMIIDNDDAQGHSNFAVGFSYTLSGNNLYLNDARYTDAYSLDFYRWIGANHISKNLYRAQLSVYLNSYVFTDTAAIYVAEIYNNFTQTGMGTINQYAAPGGWYDLPAKNLNLPIHPSTASETYYTMSAIVIASQQQSMNTGADGMSITYYY